jgi:hypothetical protein
LLRLNQQSHKCSAKREKDKFIVLTPKQRKRRKLEKTPHFWKIPLPLIPITIIIFLSNLHFIKSPLLKPSDREQLAKSPLASREQKDDPQQQALSSPPLARMMGAPGRPALSGDFEVDPSQVRGGVVASI